MYFSALEDIFQNIWTWLEYCKGSNTRKSQFYTKIIWWKVLVIIKLCVFLSHTNQPKLSVMEIFASRCASFNSVPKTFIFQYCLLLPNPTTSPAWFIFKSRIFNLQLWFKEKIKTTTNQTTKQNPHIKCFNQISFPLASEPFLCPNIINLEDQV